MDDERMNSWLSRSEPSAGVAGHWRSLLSRSGGARKGREISETARPLEKDSTFRRRLRAADSSQTLSRNTNKGNSQQAGCVCIKPEVVLGTSNSELWVLVGEQQLEEIGRAHV